MLEAVLVVECCVLLFFAIIDSKWLLDDIRDITNLKDSVDRIKAVIIEISKHIEAIEEEKGSGR